uniref:Putative DNA binding, helix-turn-helix domain containing protein n=1 Tax=viral metagenome TaxID=1070528 RepID=A0A6M3KVH6_9ZZZZ
MNGKEILNRRLDMQLTQEQLAERVGVSTFTILRWEKGYSKPSALAARRLREVIRGRDEPEG